MICISVLQPWASLIALSGHPDPEVRRLAKKFETRSWATKYRGPLAIHASKGFPKWARELCDMDPFKLTLTRAGITNISMLPLGAVIAVCHLADCIEIVWSLEDVERIAPSCLVGEHGKIYTISDEEGAFGDYTPGRFAWLLESVRMLPEPVPAKGMRRLWEFTFPEGG